MPASGGRHPGEPCRHLPADDRMARPLPAPPADDASIRPASHLVLYAANQFHGGAAARTRPIETNILEVVLPGDPAANVYQDTLAGDDCAGCSRRSSGSAPS